MDSDFRILGELEVLQEGRPVDLGSPRQRALLARLLVSVGEAVSTERLIDDLWYSTSPDKAKRTLQVYVSRLRTALGRDGVALEHRGTGYCLDVAHDALDASRFESLAEDGQQALMSGDAELARSLLGTALDLWRGPALPEFPDDAFACVEAARLEEERVSAEEARIWADLRLGHHTAVVRDLSELVARYPFREIFREQLMLALYRCGRQAEALRSYQAARICFVEELGLEPGPALRAMESRILSQDPSLDRVQSDAVSPDSVRLPSYLTSFIGRKAELERAKVLLEDERLLTVTGAPGVGKTRFALEIARSQAHGFQHGVYFVSLAPVVDPRHTERAIAQALGLVEAQGRPVAESVKAFFRHRESLLILDNFEQILGAASQIEELLGAAPGLTVVITSRSPLQISGEQRFPLPPLRVPPVDGKSDAAELAGYDAVQLFRARACASHPTFDPDREAMAVVAEIVARLDGLPLAIELAASRSDVLTPEELLSLITDRVLVFDGVSVDVGSRHRTIRDAIGWSFELLDPSGQAFLRQLSVFVGGFTIEAAAAVAQSGARGAREATESLVAGSLVSRASDSRVSPIALLELIREFARAELAAAGEDERVAARHAEFYRGFVEEREPLLTTVSGPEATLEIDADLDNLREALRFALNEPDPDLGLQIAASLWRYWQATGRLVEGREWLESLLEIPGASASKRTDGLIALAGVSYWQGDYDKAMEVYVEALDLLRLMDDSLTRAEVLFSMSATANFQHDLASGEEYAREARKLFEEVGSTEGIGRVLVAEGFSRWRRGDYSAALAKYEKACGIARAAGDAFMGMTAAVGVAALSFLNGDTRRALVAGAETLAEASAVHNEHVVVWILDLIAAFCVREQPSGAVQLAGAAESLRSEAGGGMVVDSFDIEPARAVATSFLNEEDLHEAWAMGGAMNVEDAISLAHHLADVGLVDAAQR